MKDGIRSILTSEKGRMAVNALFFLSLAVRNRGFIFIAYAAWILYLAYCIKTSASKAAKVVHGIFIIFAVAMIALNLYFYIRYTFS